MSLESNYNLLELIQKGAGGSITIQQIQEDIEEIPSELWNGKTIFVDAKCENGLRMREVLDRLMECDDLVKQFPSRQEREEHILKKQLFGIAQDEMSSLITQRMLYGYIGRFDNIKYINPNQS